MAGTTTPGLRTDSARWALDFLSDKVGDLKDRLGYIVEGSDENKDALAMEAESIIVNTWIGVIAAVSNIDIDHARLDMERRGLLS